MRRRDARAVARRHAEKVLSGELARQSVVTGATAEITGLSRLTVRQLSPTADLIEKLQQRHAEQIAWAGWTDAQTPTAFYESPRVLG